MPDEMRSRLKRSAGSEFMLYDSSSFAVACLSSSRRERLSEAGNYYQVLVLLAESS